MIDYDNEKRLYFEQLDLFDDMDNDNDNDWTLLINDKEYKVYETDEKFDVGNKVLYTLVEHENMEYLERGGHLVNRVGYVLLDADMGGFFPLYHGEYWDGMEEELDDKYIGIIESIDPIGMFDTMVFINIKTQEGIQRIGFDHRPFKYLINEQPDLIGKKVRIIDPEGDTLLQFLECDDEGYFG